MGELEEFDVSTCFVYPLIGYLRQRNHSIRTRAGSILPQSCFRASVRRTDTGAGLCAPMDPGGARRWGQAKYLPYGRCGCVASRRKSVVIYLALVRKLLSLERFTEASWNGEGDRSPSINSKENLCDSIHLYSPHSWYYLLSR